MDKQWSLQKSRTWMNSVHGGSWISKAALNGGSQSLKTSSYLIPFILYPENTEVFYNDWTRIYIIVLHEHSGTQMLTYWILFWLIAKFCSFSLPSLGCQFSFGRGYMLLALLRHAHVICCFLSWWLGNKIIMLVDYCIRQQSTDLDSGHSPLNRFHDLLCGGNVTSIY